MFSDQRVHMVALADLAAWTRLAHGARDVIALLHERDPRWESFLVNVACACAARFTKGRTAAHDARVVEGLLHEKGPSWESALVNVACTCAA